MYGTKGYWAGKKLSKEHCENLSKSHLGIPAWNKGLPKKLQPQYGRKKSEETKKQIGKANSGENNGMAKLTMKIVDQIKKDYSTDRYTHKDLSKKYKISTARICWILTGKAWVK